MDETAAVPSRARALVELGFATAVAQAVLLREAMAALGGSELAWGAVLGVWLAAMGGGSAAGVRMPNARLARWAPLAVILLCGLGVVLLRAVPALAGLGVGENAATWRGAWAWVAAVLPAAAVGGWAFPNLVVGRDAGDGPGLAYALEGGGGLIGGVAFTFALAPFGSAAAVTVSAGLLAALTMAGVRRWWLAVGALAAGVALAKPAGDALAGAGWAWSGRIGGLGAWRETRQERLELSATAPVSLYADGRLVATFPDPYRAGPRAHLALLLHPRPRRVLAIGALLDGSLPAMLGHPLETLDLVEEDPAVVGTLRRWLGGPLARALADPRVRLHAGEPLRVLAGEARWDEILLLDPDPMTLRLNRTRTSEFFRACADHLATGGVLVVRVGVDDTYLGGVGGRLLAVLASSLKRAFPGVTGIPGEEVLLLATADPRAGVPGAAELTRRYRERMIRDPGFTPEMLGPLLDPGRAARLDAFIETARAAVNVAAHPRATLLAAALSEGRGNPPLLRAAAGLERRGPGWLVVAGALAVASLLLRAASGSALGWESGAVVGFVSMGLWLLLLSAWQGTVGAVYAQVGGLSAAFMGGVVAGAGLARRNVTTARALALVLLAGCLISITLASGLPLAWPRTTIVPLLVLAGGVAGAAFPAVAALLGRTDARRGAGSGFAADEVGAAFGALVLGLLVLPWVGMRWAALALAVLGAAAASGLALTARRGG